MPKYRSMKTAPKDGGDIIIAVGKQEERVSFYDCSWLRSPFDVRPGVALKGEDVADCWRTGSGRDFELDEPRGWRPVESVNDWLGRLR